MTYFKHDDQPRQQHQRVFHQPVADEPQAEYDEDYGYDGEYDYDEEAFLTEEERAFRRRDRWQVLAGIGDFLAVIAGTVVILVMIALLVSLVNWVYADITQSFTLWQTKL